MPQIVIKTSPELSAALRSNNGTEAERLTDLVREYGYELSRPSENSGEASLYYMIESVEGQSGDVLRQALAALPGVEAAYVKPADELP